ncbi:MAG: TetR/AcrR family transcriptional regulator [Bacilli bacterium]|nr:TetR/AcrR family transcriptional regulator [Bacilli bacterium]
MSKTEKSYAAIHHALEKLMLERDYESINVSDIIAESGVARSTFYAHYKCKDDVLVELSNHIFEHVFSANLKKEKEHDFSNSPAFDYRHIVTHTFCHFVEDKALISAIFRSGASHVFTESLREKSLPLIEAVYSANPPFMPNAPKDIGISILQGAFIDLLKSYVTNDRPETPEQMADFFFAIRFPKQ